MYIDRLERAVKLDSDLRKILKIAKYISIYSNQIKTINMNGQYVPLKIEDMQVIFDTTLRATKEFLRRMSKAGVIRCKKFTYSKRTSKVYFFNPYFLSATDKLNIQTYFLFKDFLDRELSDVDRMALYEKAGLEYEECKEL